MSHLIEKRLIEKKLPQDDFADLLYSCETFLAKSINMESFDDSVAEELVEKAILCSNRLKSLNEYSVDSLASILDVFYDIPVEDITFLEKEDFQELLSKKRYWSIPISDYITQIQKSGNYGYFLLEIDNGMNSYRNACGELDELTDSMNSVYKQTLESTEAVNIYDQELLQNKNLVLDYESQNLFEDSEDLDGEFIAITNRQLSNLEANEEWRENLSKEINSKIRENSRKFNSKSMAIDDLTVDAEISSVFSDITSHSAYVEEMISVVRKEEESIPKRMRHVAKSLHEGIASSQLTLFQEKFFEECFVSARHDLESRCDAWNQTMEKSHDAMLAYYYSASKQSQT